MFNQRKAGFARHELGISEELLMKSVQVERFYLGCLAHASYMIASEGVAAVIDPTLRREFQALRLRASRDATWTIDGKHVRSDWPLVPGRHTVAAVDERGRRDTVMITVR